VEIMPQLEGIIPPVVTPFATDGSIDERAFRNEVRYMVETAHVHGLAVCGSTGEGHALAPDEARALVRWAVEETAGRVPVIAGIIADSTAAAVERALAVSDLNVAALQVTPVHYVFRPDDDAMVEFFAAITEKSGLPVLIYNVIPWSYLLPPLLARIMYQVPGVIGVKQSASDMKALADLLLLNEEGRCGEGRRILSAVDALLYPSFALGAHGAIAAVLSAVPEWCVALWNAVREGDHATALNLHRRLLRMWNAINEPNLPANVKTAMALQGRHGGVPRAPMPSSSSAHVQRIREALA
jgi:4-hydroxy-tetrahydrodipicolinate synthase